MDACITAATSMGIDIGKKRCDCCVSDRSGNVLERGQCPSTVRGAGQAAQEMTRKYDGKR